MTSNLLSLTPNTHTFIGCEADDNTSKIVLFGAPFDSTTSFRPGTRFATEAIRSDSYGLEIYSPYFDQELNTDALLDIGDLELPFGSAERALQMIEDQGRLILDKGKIPFLIGGEHLVSLGTIKASYEKYPDMFLLHFDAHTDLRQDYLGEKLSHACVIRRAWDFIGDGRIYQFGIRSGEKAEFEWAKTHTTLEKFHAHTLEQVVSHIGRSNPCYVTIDLDIFDPSLFSGTGTPEPGGIFFNEMMDIMKALSKLNIIGADVVELSPHYDPSGVSTAVACKTIRELLIAILQK